ncbi:MAG: hypothetical protein SGI92_21640 [Bryobacteraceae bacterium]|nr:hypothetical protein [Bryobacteraceae bacterium]
MKPTSANKRNLAILFALTALALTAFKKPDLSGILPSTATAGKQANDAFLVASAQ